MNVHGTCRLLFCLELEVRLEAPLPQWVNGTLSKESIWDSAINPEPNRHGSRVTRCQNKTLESMMMKHPREEAQSEG